MNGTSKEYTFAGNVPEMYDRILGPVMFEPYAEDVVRRLPTTAGLSALEIAAGTGRVTRHLLDRLPGDGSLFATDLNLDMLAIAQRTLADPRLVWEIADAQNLPFPDQSFDVAICQFGAMFFPDKLLAYREAHRVLRAGGDYFLTVWGSHARNPWAGVAHRVLHELFPEDPIVFMNKPFGYHDEGAIASAVSEAGFASVTSEWVTEELVADSAGAFARGVMSGTPVCEGVTERRGDIETCVHALAAAFRAEFGDHPMQSTMGALVVTAHKA